MSLGKLIVNLVVSFLASNAFAVGFDDAQTTKVMKTANEGEIQAAQVAQAKAQNADVKAFAKMMIDEHTKNEKDLKSLATKERITWADSATATKLDKDATDKVASLREVKGSTNDFDRAYITSQIDMHQALLTELNANLIPSVQNGALRTYLETTKTHVEKHLAEAKRIQAKL